MNSNNKNNQTSTAANITNLESAWLENPTDDGLRCFCWSPDLGEKVEIGLHNGPFHADEVLSLVLLAEFWHDGIPPYVRTRNPERLAKTLRIDVGEGPLDHHGQRAEKGVAACSRVFDALLRGGFISAAEEAALRPIVAAVAAWDCGDDSLPHPLPYVGALAHAATATGDDMDAAFATALDMAMNHINAVLAAARAAAEAEAEAAAIISKAGAVAVFPASCRAADVKKMLWEAKAATVFYCSPEGDQWRILCCANPESEEYSPFDSRRLLPERFRGLRGDALSTAAGIPGGVFCHQAGFIAGFETKEAAIAFAELSLND